MDSLPRMSPDYPTGEQLEKMIRQAAGAGVFAEGSEVALALPMVGISWDSIAALARAEIAPYANGELQAVALSTFVKSYIFGVLRGLAVAGASAN